MASLADAGSVRTIAQSIARVRTVTRSNMRMPISKSAVRRSCITFIAAEASRAHCLGGVRLLKAREQACSTAAVHPAASANSEITGQIQRLSLRLSSK